MVGERVVVSVAVVEGVEVGEGAGDVVGAECALCLSIGVAF